jgi:hypothetical protein
VPIAGWVVCLGPRTISEGPVRKLGKTPDKVVPAFERTKQGVLLLLASWTALHEALLTNGALDDARHGLVYNLLGIALELRNGSRRVPAAPPTMTQPFLVPAADRRARMGRRRGR